MLRSYQEEGVTFLNSNPSAGLHFEQGLGKTITTLTHLSQNTFKLPALIVCPKSVIPVWNLEVKTHGFNFSVVEISGSKDERLSKLNQKADIHVINYEGMRLLHPHLLKNNYKTIIFDEAHRIKSRTSKQTQVAFKLSEKTQSVIQLTGTPMTKDPSDLWTQIYLSASKSLAVDDLNSQVGNYYVFENRFCRIQKMRIMRDGRLVEIKKVIGEKNSDVLNDLRSKFFLRKTKDECLDLPAKIYKKILITLDDDQKKNYFDAKFSLQSLLKNPSATPNILADSVMKLRQICSGFMYFKINDGRSVLNLKTNAKLTALSDLLEDTGEDKVIVLTNFLNEKELIKRKFESSYKIIDFDGDDRATPVAEFQSCKGKAIFLSNIETAKEGITLTESNHVVFFSPTYNYGSRAQVEDRAHRWGQKKNVIYYDMICLGTVEEKVFNMCHFKKETASKITGDICRMARIAADMDDEY